MQDGYSSILENIERIDTGPNGYLDLFLIHSPKPPVDVRKRVWFALERLLAEGRVKGIGVSNWYMSRIEEIKSWRKSEGAIWPPMVNQIEVSVWITFYASLTVSSYIHFASREKLFRIVRPIILS